MGRSNVAARTSNSQSIEPGFESSYCHFKSSAILFIPHCHSSLSCINGYLATDRWISHAVVAAWLNASQRTGLPGGEVSSALNSPKDWISRCMERCNYYNNHIVIMMFSKINIVRGFLLEMYIFCGISLIRDTIYFSFASKDWICF